MSATTQDHPPRYSDVESERRSSDTKTRASIWEQIAARRLSREAEEAATTLPAYTNPPTTLKPYVRTLAAGESATNRLASVFGRTITNAPHAAHDLWQPTHGPLKANKARYQVAFPPGYCDVYVKVPRYKTMTQSRKPTLPDYIIDFPKPRQQRVESEPILILRKSGLSADDAAKFHDLVTGSKERLLRRVEKQIEALTAKLVLAEEHAAALDGVFGLADREAVDYNLVRLAKIVNGDEGIAKARLWVRRYRAYLVFAGFGDVEARIEPLGTRVQRLQHRAQSLEERMKGW